MEGELTQRRMEACPSRPLGPPFGRSTAALQFHAELVVTGLGGRGLSSPAHTIPTTPLHPPPEGLPLVTSPGLCCFP